VLLMRIEIDSVDGVIEVDGVKISLDLLKHFAHPDPKKFYQLERLGETVTVTTLAPADLQRKLMAQGWPVG
jgi:hypothetical protein